MSTDDNSREEFLNYKIMALLHDPPNKAWVITSRAHNLTVQLRSVRARKSHERVAKYIINQLFGDINSKTVDNADKLASSIDRYLGSIVYKEYSLFRNRSIFLKNILLSNIQRDVGNLFPKDKSKQIGRAHV